MINIRDDKRLSAEKQKKLENAVHMGIEQMDAVGIKYGDIREISVNFRAKRWGMCTYDRLKGIYSIQISFRLLDDDTPWQSLMETVLHELCHTIPGGSGHTGTWKEAVNLLNKTYGYNIKRVNSAEEKGMNEPAWEAEYKYELRCTRCQKTFLRLKRSAIVDHPGRYRCRCGGKIVRVR